MTKAQETNIQIRVDVPHDMPLLEADRDKVKQVLLNLVINGLEAVEPHGGRVTVEGGRTNGWVELRVSDNGLGIDMKKFGDKLFGLHRTFHSHAEARGVGLFLIKTQIESMGGFISAESEVDKGTTFTIRFG